MEDLNFEQPSVAEADKDTEYEDKLVLKVFHSNPDGKKLLELFKKGYYSTPVCVPGQVEGMGYFREGQNSVWRMIDSIISQKLSVK